MSKITLYYRVLSIVVRQRGEEMTNITPWVKALLENAIMLGDEALLFSPDNLNEVVLFIVEFRKVCAENDPESQMYKELLDPLPGQVQKQVIDACKYTCPELVW